MKYENISEKYNAEHKDELREKQRKYRAEHADELRKKRQIYYAEKKANKNKPIV